MSGRKNRPKTEKSKVDKLEKKVEDISEGLDWVRERVDDLMERMEVLDGIKDPEERDEIPGEWE